MFFNELEFYKNYMRWCEKKGHTYRLSDIEYAWREYQQAPWRYDYLERKVRNG